ncbi:UDP-N-acetylglucosamine--N-acetylmuramyl-(pentapeptide) pyrophosphoryl-undecaprenol N-acetylglucosamine transferase [Desulfitobacterium dichloroeliminans LMG P-21439]|uniref:UDP-N-acetylglucosamine--N-acetylmuramyl-(pentapeptide) pyrophosphoryl-undecaprenol N-acetylglucosamine transferase n=1 Tax=Desulfitobacterium dichloroeliminans (strain LMG P-21439 / DCA1) TaxID=871963 RepID=L0FB98_DESDL|nr:undecaprenyldiphospho-muramoylpentapeptide beta-N-acetylglucosaminyltransferase [Desulfitobacterium dichloroeliminans]AGA70218.1 UDP-N-acetylglucosamine--N-acetylmuramyl-(pentapeptide) pyrophosphoryl-undecaprenol N-acetylglucosamine transferase [Desulfitobacterium dichloroeliminans LMG P-21439]
MRVIVTGGGTGGHIYPALAIAKGILAKVPDSEILYVGTREGMEARLVPEAGISFKGVSGQGLPRKISLDTLKVGGKTIKALWETKEILKKYKPDLVVGTGGYVSGPVVLTAALFGIPTLLHEQNALPGITNKILTRFVRKVMVTFPESIAHFGVRKKLILTGLPVRPEIGSISRQKGADCLGLRPEHLTLLVTGGSRGARSINQAMPKVLRQLANHPEIQVIWATGKATYQETVETLKAEGIQWQRENWRILEYLKAMPEALACADLFVGRAGATTLAEIMVAGKPGILIPYPFAAENHQEFNARALEKDGAARVILDQDLTGENLWAVIQGLAENPEQLAEMSRSARKSGQPDALEKIVKVCLDTAWK